MRFGWIFIPVLVFLIALSIGTANAHNLRREARRVYETAKQNDWPLVVANSTNRSYHFGMYTLEGDGASLPSPYQLNDFRQFYFGDDPVIYFPDWQNYNVIRIPDFKLDMIYVKIPDYLGTGWHVDRGYASNSGRYIVQQRRREVEGGWTTDFLQVDVTTGETFEAEFDLETEWQKQGWGSIRELWIDDGGLYVLSWEQEPWTPGSYNSYGDDFALFRYDIESESWSVLYEVMDVSPYAWIHHGQDSDVVGFSYRKDVREACDSYLVEFINGKTGDILKTVSCGTCVVVGLRWAACFIIDSDYTDEEIILFDMEDNWMEYKIPNSSQPESRRFYSQFIALYEFPD